MNSFYQINSSTIFLEIIVLIVKIIESEGLLEILPAIIAIFAGLLLLKFYISHQSTLKNYLIMLQLFDILFINLFQKRNSSVSHCKYLLVGQFISIYGEESVLKTFLYLLFVGIIMLLEMLIYEGSNITGYVLLLWIAIFQIGPALLLLKKKQDKEHILDQQLPFSADISQIREQANGERVKLQIENRKQEEFPLDFYKEILQKHHEGILILDGQRECKFQSDSMKKILGVWDKSTIVPTLLGLKNCQNAIKEQERLIMMFQALASKFTSDVELEKDEQKDELIEQQHAFSSSENVEQEFDRVMNSVKEKLPREDWKRKTETKIKFILENFMICQQDYLTKSFDRQQTFSSAYRGPTIYEVIQRPFLFENNFYMLFTIKDVTHFNQIRVLQAINENKSQMLAQVAHEFRTPLNCICLFLDNLAEQLDDELINEYIKPISISTKTLLSLVNDLLDVAQLKAGKFKLFHTKMDISELITEIQQFLRPQIQAKNNQLQITIFPKTSMILYSDPNRIRQIIFNLVNNANKFTKNGTITIDLVKQNAEIYEISIRDTGVGIDLQDQSKLFQAFSKLDKNKELNAQGVGLGLMISNILAERLSIPANIDNSAQYPDMQGLKVYSEGRDKGTTFTFKILDQHDYLTQQQNQSKITIRIPDAESDSVQMTIRRTKTKLDRQFDDDVLKSDIYIMIVDDEPFNIVALSKSLKKKFNVEGFFSGMDAIRRINQPLPLHTIILQDIEMPDMDGFEVAKQIKSLVGDQVYIIGCSAHTESYKQRCLDAGMDDFLTKPVRLDNLMKVIDKLF